MTLRWLSRTYTWLENRVGFGVTLWQFIVPAGAFALPAWGSRVAGVFSEYAPVSWIAAGFLGLFAYTLCAALYGYAQSRLVRSKYDSKFLAETGGVDPLAKVFEGKRIFLNDFILPSNPIVDGKTFVDCEIVGPANMFLQVGNAINNVRSEKVDAIALDGKTPFLNGFIFRNCTFRGCTLLRVSLFFTPVEATANAHVEWLNWISPLPSQAELPGLSKPTLIEDQTSQPPEGIAEETPR
jgi:hypothetical protein